MSDQTTTTMNQGADAARRAGEQAWDAGRSTMEQGRDMARQAWDAGQHPQTLPSEQHREGRIARTIEQQTAKLPSDTFLWAALGAVGGSLAFQIAGKKATSNFIGQWVPTLLVLGLYNKMVKLLGSDAR